MKTRTLLLLALACGVAIMVAGAALLIRLSTTDEPGPPNEVGEPVAVGDARVTVGASEESSGTLTVSVLIGGVSDDQPADGFRLIASGRPVEPEAVECEPVTRSEVACDLGFDVSVADSSSRVLFYDRGDDRVRWVLSE